MNTVRRICAVLTAAAAAIGATLAITGAPAGTATTAAPHHGSDAVIMTEDDWESPFV